MRCGPGQRQEREDPQTGRTRDTRALQQVMALPARAARPEAETKGVPMVPPALTRLVECAGPPPHRETRSWRTEWHRQIRSANRHAETFHHLRQPQRDAIRNRRAPTLHHAQEQHTAVEQGTQTNGPLRARILQTPPRAGCRLTSDARLGQPRGLLRAVVMLRNTIHASSTAGKPSV